MSPVSAWTVGSLSMTRLEPPKAWGWANTWRETARQVRDRWTGYSSNYSAGRRAEKEREKHKVNRQNRQAKTTSAENKRSLADPNPLIHMGLQCCCRVANYHPIKESKDIANASDVLCHDVCPWPRECWKCGWLCLLNQRQSQSPSALPGLSLITQHLKTDDLKGRFR